MIAVCFARWPPAACAEQLGAWSDGSGRSTWAAPRPARTPGWPTSAALRTPAPSPSRACGPAASSRRSRRAWPTTTSPWAATGRRAPSWRLRLRPHCYGVAPVVNFSVVFAKYPSGLWGIVQSGDTPIPAPAPTALPIKQPAPAALPIETRSSPASSSPASSRSPAGRAVCASSSGSSSSSGKCHDCSAAGSSVGTRDHNLRKPNRVYCGDSEVSISGHSLRRLRSLKHRVKRRPLPGLAFAAGGREGSQLSRPAACA